MKKTLSIHLGRQLFVIEEDAFDRLQEYLKRLEQSLQGESGVAEIIEDIEMRFAELLTSYLGETRKVVTIGDIQKGVDSLGEPEVISEESTKEETNYKSSTYHTTGTRKLFRDTENGVLAGVCSGVAAYLNLDPVIVRILFIIFSFTGIGVPLYIVLWAIVPNAATPSERLQMQGKPVTVDALKDEFVKAADRIKNDTLRARDRLKTGNDHIAKRVRSLSRILVKLFGIALIAGAVLWLIFFSLTITGAIDFIPMTGDEEYTSLHDFLQIVSPVDKTFGLLWISILLIGFGAPLLAILTGTRFIMEKSNRFFKINLIVFPLMIGIGIICGILSSLQIARDYAVYEGFEQQQLTSNADTLVVSELPHYYAGHRIVSSGGIDFIQVKNRMVTEEGIIVTYRPSKDSLFHIHKYISANGVDSEAALKRGGHIRHEMQLLGEKLIIDPYFSYPTADGFRAQRIKVIIEVPEGKTLLIKNWKVLNPQFEHNGTFHAGKAFEIWRDHVPAEIPEIKHPRHFEDPGLH